MTVLSGSGRLAAFQRRVLHPHTDFRESLYVGGLGSSDRPTGALQQRVRGTQRVALENVPVYCVWISMHKWLAAGVARPSESPFFLLSCFGPTTPKHRGGALRVSVRLNRSRELGPACDSPQSAKSSDAHSAWGGFRERPQHKPLDLLLLIPISRFGDSPRGTVGPQGRDSRRRGGCDADDPQNRGGELLTRQGPVPRHAQRVTIDPQEVGEVGRRHPRRATASQ